MRAVLAVLVALFPVSEVLLAFIKRSRGQEVRREDRGSLRLLWLSITGGVIVAVAAEGVSATRLPGSVDALRLVALVLLAGGLALRWAAIITLGRLFTVDVAIHSGHRVVSTGLYARVRHPSYTGMLIAFLGLGVWFRNWLSIAALLVPIGAAVVNRVMKEERALLTALGAEYADYCARTKRFVPGIF